MWCFYFVFAIVGCFVNGERYKLPKNVVPVRYYLTVEPILSTTRFRSFLFYGSVAIELKVLCSTYQVTFHGDNIQIPFSSIKVTDVNGQTIAINNVSFNDSTLTYTLHTKSRLQRRSRYILTINNFSGTLGLKEGFCLIEYYVNGTTRLAAATHFQPKGARKAFPCFDEPRFKAKFIVNIIRTSDYYSLSNQVLDYTEALPNGRFKDVYKETPIMSTYILAFAVLDFDASERQQRTRIYSLSGVIKSINETLKITTSLLNFYETYTRVKYALDKIDHLVLPNGALADRAMENWGLITYQQRYFNDTGKPLISKEVLMYKSHELAHQWFGNLVTPKSFDYLWLSESIAAYFQFYATSFIQPSWQLMEQFVIDNMHNAFAKEEKNGAHSLNYYLSDSEKFPPFYILYEKGSSILRMLVHILSEEVFQKSMHLYLNKNKYKNVVPNNLYGAFQESLDMSSRSNSLAGMSVAKIMRTWDSNPGYPIVKVTRNYETGSVLLKQEAAISKLVQKLWTIPISYVHSENPNFGNTTPALWLTKSKNVISNIGPDGWLIVNTQQSGHYRVNYDLKNWERIIAFLQNGDLETIHVLNRAQIINDAFYFARMRKLPLRIPLVLSEYLVREKDYIPFASFFNSVSNYLDVYLGIPSEREVQFFENHWLGENVGPSEPDEYPREYIIFQKYILYITNNVRNYLGSENRPQDTFIDRLFRAELDRHFPYYFRNLNKSDS